jgi:hypothetical protein
MGTAEHPMLMLNCAGYSSGFYMAIPLVHCTTPSNNKEMMFLTSTVSVTTLISSVCYKIFIKT